MSKDENTHRERDSRGRFVKGHRIGEATRFEAENACACKYKEEYADMMLDYFKNCEGYPTFEAFADSLSVVSDTLRNWCSLSPRFRHYYARARELQRSKLICGGLCGEYNPQFAKFIAINHHGMSDKVSNDTELTFKIKLADEIDEEAE